MRGDNATGADNQQETAIPRTRLEPTWVDGFVDGEGCFCVSVHKNPYVRRTRGWQLHPTFQVYQHERYRSVLEELIPFFEQHQLIIKATDFDLFAEVVRSMLRKEHLEPAGFERLVRLAFEMNLDGKQRARTLDEVLAGSSETVRQALL